MDNYLTKGKYFVILLVLLALVPEVYSQGNKYQLLVGTYTRGSSSDGIYIYEFNSQTGETEYKSKANINNPSYLAVSADGNFVYSVSQDSTNNINAFAYNSSSGSLTYVNAQVSGGDGPTYISVDSSRRYVFSANYGGGSVSAIPIKEDGSLGSNIQTIKHTGESVNQQRQKKPYVHSVVLAPDEKKLLAQDLGTDKVYVYQYNPERTAPLIPADPPFLNIAPGSGPRHLTFHPNGRYAYLINEINSTITILSYKDGHLEILQTVSILPKDFTGKGGAADIQVSADGKFLYGSNRGTANDIAIYSINENNGKLTFVGRQPTMGEGARTFAIDPTGKFVLVANTATNNITIFKRDKKTGLLEFTGDKLTVGKPSCLKFL